jgi:hypothetical protein
MYSGFVTSKKVVDRLGIHQRFDMAGYRMIEKYLPQGFFPPMKDILYWEGYNGPDGLKVKSPKQADPSHLYDPKTDTGAVPGHITVHYEKLVRCLKNGDIVRAGFEASWMAHYIGDGLTPAHHWPLEEKIAEAVLEEKEAVEAGDVNKLLLKAKKNWAVWGAKGHLSTHFYFEMGIAFALLIYPIKGSFKPDDFARARRLGYLEYFKEQARDVATLDLYERFYKQGWNSDIAAVVKNKIAPMTAETIGVIWLLAVLEAGQELAIEEIMVATAK